MLFFEADSDFDSGQVNHGLIWLVECGAMPPKRTTVPGKNSLEQISLLAYNHPQMRGISHPQRSTRCIQSRRQDHSHW